MKIHHLNCGTMHPLGAPCGLVCHVLLIETRSGLVLVDSGLGLLDVSQPGRRFGPSRAFVRPVFSPEEAAIVQIERMGFDPRDVRHILLTHFDADHVGGLADFPWAQVHLTSAEAFAARHPKTLVERGRYLPAAREHGPLLVEHTPQQSNHGAASRRPNRWPRWRTGLCWSACRATRGGMRRMRSMRATVGYCMLAMPSTITAKSTDAAARRIRSG
ncbi:MBL fold metallo-hydrolase [Duganella guangzhouensis]|uniref:MBL fold metallo-hydrolase n=1 Tax=Duganella guangzhouensis TaxID=2666084 RepID=UPI001E45553D|nr:MBL fold metallo-hydrolase [Duganella guangzhouensis]